MPEFTVQAFSSFTAVKRIFFLRIFKKRLFTKKHRIFILSCKYQSDCCRILTFQDASRCAATSKMLYCNTHVHILLSELSEFRSKKTNQFRRMLYTIFYVCSLLCIRDAYPKAAELRKAAVRTLISIVCIGTMKLF